MRAKLNNFGPSAGRRGFAKFPGIGLSVAAMLVIGAIVMLNVNCRSKSKTEPKPESQPESGTPSDSSGYLHALSTAQIRAKVTNSITNLKQMYQGLAVYQIDNGRYPDSLDDMKDVLPPDGLVNPFDKTIPYVYIKPGEPQDRGDIVFYDPIVVQGQVCAAHMDGSVQRLSVDDFKKKLAAQGAECRLIEK